METTQRNMLIGLGGLVLITLGAYLYLHRAPAPNTLPSGNTSATTSVSTTSESQTTGSVPVTVHIGGSSQIPSFTKPLVFSADISADAKTALQTQFDALKTQLSKNTNQMDLWVSLGTLRKIAGDYAGAIEDWNFVAADGSSVSYIAYGNLADMYSNFVKDYPKAEASYLAAIKLEPTYIDFYRGLFTLYANVYKKGTSAAEDILKQGIAANPNAFDLQVTLAQYYRSLGRTTDAKAEYDAAIANAKAQGQTTAAAQIQTEENSF